MRSTDRQSRRQSRPKQSPKPRAQSAISRGQGGAPEQAGIEPPEQPAHPAHPASPEQPAAGAAPALTEELAQTFFELLIRHRAGFRDVLGQTGLSVTQLHVLQNLGEGPMTMRELASASFCEPSALTGIVDKLEALGFLSRRASTEDRRSKQVSLTRSGAAFRRRLLDRFKEPAPWMAALSHEDQLQFLTILRRAIALAQPVEPGTEFSLRAPAPAPSRPSSRSSGRPSSRSGGPGGPGRPGGRRSGS